MIKKNQRLLNFINVVSDGLVILTSYFASTWLWLDILKGASENIAIIQSLKHGIGIVAIVYSLIMLLLLAIFGLYNTTRIHRLRRSVLTILEANALGILFVGAILYLLRLQDFSRGVLTIFSLISSGLLVFKRIILRIILTRAREKGFNQKHVIVVGTGKLARKYSQNVGKEQNIGFTILGYFGTKREDFQEKYIGGIDAIKPFVRQFLVDEIVIALEPNETDLIMPVITICEGTGVKVAIIPFYNDIIPSCPSIEVLGDTKLIYLRSTPLDNLGYAFIKRILDILISAVLILLLSPLMLVSAIGIKLSSPGPVIFKQQRVGRHKRLFWMYKLRSMRENKTQETGWTTNSDTRRTWFGKLIRKCSIDELPQLFNVLKGDMSVIGPRPEVPFYVEKFAKDIPLYMVKHQVRPGMTGWAQVNGYRGNTSIEKRIEYDIWYIENWSLRLDIKIFFRTIFGAWINPEKII